MKPASRWLSALRAPFLLASLLPCLMGAAWAAHLGLGMTPWMLPAALLVLGLLHAGVNVINDYHDHLTGTDTINRERVAPFTGGSRVIQEGLLSPPAVRRLGGSLLALSALLGIGLALVTDPALLAVGLAGLLIGWGYSAPPLRLNSRGLGEPSVAMAFALIPAGMVMVAGGGFTPSALILGLPTGLLVTCMLYINQFPDRRADALSGKLHWVARLAPARARWGYPLLAAGAYLALIAAVWAGAMPGITLFGLAAAPLSLAASAQLMKHYSSPGKLAPAIRLTLWALLLHAGLITAGLWLQPR
jgi:1,4-dihydroxy-2-naphthoate polyprenyltransferase